MPPRTSPSTAPKKLLRCIPNPPLLKRAKLSQAILALDLANRQPADARQRPSAVGNRDRHHDLVGARRVVDLHFHAIEMAAHEGRVLVAERNVQRAAGTAALFRRWNQR